MSKVLYLIDRSRVSDREDCPRKRYLGYDFDGDGLDAEEGSLPLLSGIAIHAAHARLLAGAPLEKVIEEIISDYKREIEKRGLLGLQVTQDVIREQSALLEGMLRTWAVLRMPMILEEYEVVSIEQTFDWELVPGILAERFRFDALLRRRDDGYLHILDYKTLGYPSEMWEAKFDHNLQTCLYVQAAKERYNEPVAILYEGLVKGQFRKDTARNSKWFGQKIQTSPYTIAYRLAGDGLCIYQTEYTSKKGYHKVRTFEEMSMKEWVEDWLLPEGKANELFVIVPPIEPPSYELERAKHQVIREEIDYHGALERHRELTSAGVAGVEAIDSMAKRQLDAFAPLRTNQCFKYGQDYKCKFLGICFNQGVEPLGENSGFVKRVPHHDTDLNMVN